MRFTCLQLAVWMSCLSLAAPAYAQKLPVKKLISSNAPRKYSQAAVIARRWQTSAVQEMRQFDRLFNKAILKDKQAQLPPLLDVLSFRIYHEQYGLVATVSDLWSTLLTGLHIHYFGPRSNSSPADLRKMLLQNEARLKHSIKTIRELKPIILSKATPLLYSRLAHPHMATRFFFTDTPGMDVFSKEVAAYTAGEKDAVSLMANGQEDIETLYRRMLDFAHGKKAFPFRTSEVYNILALREYTQEELADLQQDLNSIECDILRSWGWNNRDIRRVIALYRSEDWIQPYHEADFMPGLMKQHDLLSSWRKYWNKTREQDLSATLQLIQQTPR